MQAGRLCYSLWNLHPEKRNRFRNWRLFPDLQTPIVTKLRAVRSSDTVCSLKPSANSRSTRSGRATADIDCSRRAGKKVVRQVKHTPAAATATSSSAGITGSPLRPRASGSAASGDHSARRVHDVRGKDHDHTAPTAAATTCSAARSSVAPACSPSAAASTAGDGSGIEPKILSEGAKRAIGAGASGSPGSTIV